MTICTIKILDEVNVKIEGLDIVTRRKCVNKLSFMLPNARFLPSFKLGKWNGKVNFCSMGMNTQINLLDRILPIIQDAGYEIEIEDQRKTYDFKFSHIDKNYTNFANWPSDHSTQPNKPIELTDKQVIAINSFLDDLQGIQSLATGFGKTLTVAALSKIVESVGRTILIVPSKDLVEQTIKTYQLLGLDCGVYYGDEKNWNKKHTICTWQSLDRFTKDTKDDLLEEDKDVISFIEGVSTVIVDECHILSGTAIRNLMTGIFRNIPIRWGLTGTVPKQEHLYASLVSSIGNVIHEVTTKELQDIGTLSNCKIEIIQTQEFVEFNNYKEENQYLTTNPKRLKWLAEFSEAVGTTGNTLILVNRIETGKKINAMIPNSVFVSGTTKSKDRKKEYASVANEDNKIIIATFGVASTGIDIPRLNNLIIFESGKSFTKVIQSIGRVLRIAFDKDSSTIYDICCSTKYSRKHLTERKRYFKEAQYPFTITKVLI